MAHVHAWNPDQAKADFEVGSLILADTFKITGSNYVITCYLESTIIGPIIGESSTTATEQTGRPEKKEK